jgi:hypothetical protein
LAPFHCPACTPPPPHHGGVTAPCGGLHDVRTDGSCAGGGVLTVSSSPRAGATTTYLFRQVHACRMRKCLHVCTVRAYALVSGLSGIEGAQVSETAYAVFTCALGARAVSFRKLPSDVDRSEGSGVFFERIFVLGTYEPSLRTWTTQCAVPHEMAHVGPQCTGRVQIPACHVCIRHVSDAFA